MYRPDVRREGTIWHPSMGPRAAAARPAPVRSTMSFGQWVLLAVGVTALVALAWWVTQSAIFRARTIPVSGNHRLSDVDVLRLAGIGPGTNVVWFSPGRAEERLRTSPWILSARVTRSLPSAIRVSVIERLPAAVLIGRRRYLVAVDDVVLGVARASVRLPTIAVGTAALRPGSRPIAARAALQAIGALPASLRRQVSSAHRDDRGDLVLRLRSGVEAVYGDAADAGAKGQAFASVLAWASEHGVQLQYVDVRAPITPAAMPMGASPGSAPRS